jgi:hypothetical protein
VSPHRSSRPGVVLLVAAVLVIAAHVFALRFAVSRAALPAVIALGVIVIVLIMHRPLLSLLRRFLR